MSFEFKKYNEIENSYRTEFLNKIHEFGYDNPMIEYVASVKVDGANFCVSIDENNKFHYSKRTMELERGDNFYSWESAMHRDNVPEKVKKIKELLVDIVEVNVYGELAGGKYNHPDTLPPQYTRYAPTSAVQLQKTGRKQQPHLPGDNMHR